MMRKVQADDMEPQETIADSVEIAGIGVHSGAPARVRLRPAPAGTGIVFFRTDAGGGDRPIPALAHFTAATANATVLRNAAGDTAATVEHLLAAAAGLGVDNLFVDIDGPELPILDGSAAPYVAALDAAGRVRQGAPRRVLRVLRGVGVADGAKTASIAPLAGAFEIDVTIRYDDPAIGVQRRCLAITPESFRAEVAPARTFGRLSDLEGLRARGLALGASLDNTVAVDAGRIANPEGLRAPDEFVRHKILDVVGDFALAGARVEGRFVGDQCGHGLNAKLLAALLADPDAYAIAGGGPG